MNPNCVSGRWTKLKLLAQMAKVSAPEVVQKGRKKMPLEVGPEHKTKKMGEEEETSEAILSSLSVSVVLADSGMVSCN